MAVELTADVVVVGAGPAGAATALMLAPFHRTLLLDRAGPAQQAPVVARIGESLPAAARRLLQDMALWTEFQNQGHAPCYAARSHWGGPAAVAADSVRDPDGPGWHLDRARFDAWLRRQAGARGAALVAPARAVGLAPTADGWRLTLTRHGRPSDRRRPVPGRRRRPRRAVGTSPRPASPGRRPPGLPLVPRPGVGRCRHDRHRGRAGRLVVYRALAGRPAGPCLPYRRGPARRQGSGGLPGAAGPSPPATRTGRPAVPGWLPADRRHRLLCRPQQLDHRELRPRLAGRGRCSTRL